jgi:hypothetical protein
MLIFHLVCSLGYVRGPVPLSQTFAFRRRTLGHSLSDHLNPGVDEFRRAVISARGAGSCGDDRWAYGFLVALPPGRDLLFSAKDLFVIAKLDIIGRPRPLLSTPGRNSLKPAVGN